MSRVIPVLLYHSVGESCDPRFGRWNVTPEAFAQHIGHLADRGYRSLTVRELATTLLGGGPELDEDTVVITFDDGFADFHAHAWPSLRRHDMRATVFVTTGHVGQTSGWLADQGEGERRMMSWQQIEEVATAGIECGAHGHRHLQLDTISPPLARSEITESKRALEAVCGPVDSFAYPHGYYTRRVKWEVERAGFRAACAVKNALSSPVDDRFAIARAIVPGGTTVEGLDAILRGEAVPREAKPRPLRRHAWRAARRAGAEGFIERLRPPASARARRTA